MRRDVKVGELFPVQQLVSYRGGLWHALDAEMHRGNLFREHPWSKNVGSWNGCKRLATVFLVWHVNWHFVAKFLCHRDS